MDDTDRARWARALTTAGWLVAFAYIGLLTAQLRLAFAIDESAFDDGVWGARIERVAVIAYPQNLLVLVPAASAGAIATVLARGRLDRTDMWLAQLVRIVAGICYVAIAIAAIRTVALITTSPDAVGDFASMLRQLGGVLIAAAMIRVCLEAERSA